MSCCAASRHQVASPVPMSSGAPAAQDKATTAPPIAGAATGQQRLGSLRYGRDNLVNLPGGTFWMGSEDADVNPHDGEGPVRQEVVEPLALSRYAVTNREFGRFVAETDHVTEAEHFGWSFVFASFLTGGLRASSPRPQQTPWWCAVEGASWAHPQGPGSSVEQIPEHPVVHVSWGDAEAYAQWAGGRLPTEIEWEYAARGGLEGARYPWGDELQPHGEHRCNIWQGQFPGKNTADDGYRGTAPVDAYAPNGYGLHNVVGNVWEMCADYWSDTTEARHGGPAGEARRVLRGGSYLCHDSYCNRYRVAARSSNGVDSSTGNQGFRLVFEPQPESP